MQQQKIDFPWHLVADEWVALARDDGYPMFWAYKAIPKASMGEWYGEGDSLALTRQVQLLLGVDLSQYENIPWQDTLTLRPDGVHQAITHNIPEWNFRPDTSLAPCTHKMTHLDSVPRKSPFADRPRNFVSVQRHPSISQ